MKFLLLNLMILFGFTKVYTNTAEFFISKVPKINAAEAEGSSGSGECHGTVGGSQHTAV